MSNNQIQEYDMAVYVEVAKERIPMEKGFNTRVFNETELKKESSIFLTREGTISFAAGLYRISALSLLSYMVDGIPGKSSDSNNPGDIEPSAGYCAICKVEEDDQSEEVDMLAIGSMMDYKDNTPSLIDTIMEFEENTLIQLKHQVGEFVENVFLQGNGNRATHVYARIAIQKL